MRILEGYASQWKKPEQINDIMGIWVPSGPGFIEKPYKDDRYKNYEWSRFMGRRRLMYAALLMRKTAEARSNGVFGSNQSIEMIEKHAPILLFNGIDSENTDIRDYLAREGLIIPPSKVHILGSGLNNTLDQVHNLASQEGQEFLNSLDGHTLSIVTHVPHATRLLHLLGKNNPFPSGLGVSLLSLPTPQQGIEYKRNEICGILSHIIRGEATVEPFIPSNISFDS